MDKIREILLKLVKEYGGTYQSYKISEVLSEIKKIRLEELPKEKSILSKEDFNTMSDEKYALKTERNIGFNQAIQEAKEKIENNP